ncbi:phage tail protein I [Pseudoalteromonas luteoviolacea]|uniref:Tail protein n=1 Tax=Pseudoalteromonas luteoviolacea S4060-1 TaxID=1365257 RepID=A0A162B575_9GAMM|nr:phage tail protein I [Pseudoalteromonas luteoviolacea]KZN66715.1 tail protein [Pseudoalteromonas luteoviolacea S4060-1]
MSNFSLLGNTTALELALEHCSDRILQTPVNIHQLWDPFQCPASFLPWLADALSVDVWDSNWPEHVKRKVIADSVPRHRYKGTVSAVNNSLNVLNAKVELQEWWQYGGVPHSAKLLAIANENLDSNGNTFLSPKLQAQMWQSVVATKPQRTQVDFTIGVNLSSDIQVIGGAQSATVQVALNRDEPIFNFAPVSVGSLACAHSNNLQVTRFSDNPNIDFNLSDIQVFTCGHTNHVAIDLFQDAPSASFTDSVTVSTTALSTHMSQTQMRDNPTSNFATSSSIANGAYTVSIQNITLNF